MSQYELWQAGVLLMIGHELTYARALREECRVTAGVSMLLLLGAICMFLAWTIGFFV